MAVVLSIAIPVGFLALALVGGRYVYVRTWYSHNKSFLLAVHELAGIPAHDVQSTWRDHADGHCVHVRPSGQGVSEAQVRAKLGTPYREVTAAEATRQDQQYYVVGYDHRERPVTGKVLIYIHRDAIAYVWLDASGQVEEVYTGPS